ncbi:thiamine pyrophosphokinase [Aspergillus heteromorphus CBS 117.55]|uniref:Thiamine pyrophosphokinase n=1 Tax=Aspergillus heteromorphus CBS 117.55 TaxID=1448321 RepID=A0A317WWH6_9EURO|nr:thiamine pyrophosphokinase [Aspergillus heteromorphus CBS 117.55]PWY90746.1 thiamine pyrophosphokinase [Aspergillus heteromorphus CBS 117.55]
MSLPSNTSFILHFTFYNLHPASCILPPTLYLRKTQLTPHTALITVCADGGANHFYDMMRSRGRESTDHPTLIIGDLDSIRPSVRSHYEAHDIPVIYHHDDYSTDFQKALNYIRAHTDEILSKTSPSPSPSSSPLPSPSSSKLSPSPPTGEPQPQQHQHQHQHQQDQPPLSILILGGLGGRVDQAFSQIHHLYTQTQRHRHLQSASQTKPGNLYLISEESITFILHSGKNIIHTPRANRAAPKPDDEKDGNGNGNESGSEGYLLEENVGIIPLSGMTRITTKGFQWDVEEWETEIGGQISTSNHVQADVVEVSAPVPVLLTLELAGRFKR